jgi:GNAT superfamily N-acetyltransferase
MIDAKNYSAEETLKNGLQVIIRAIRPDDREAFLAAFKGLEDRSVYYRFFSPKNKLSDKELTAAVEVDFIKTVALVTCVKDKDAEKIIGGGRYIAFGKNDPPDMAEVAFTVEEDYQGLGIASKLLTHLAGIAKEKGIAEFHADVLADNTGMLNVFKRSGFPMKQSYESGVAHVILSLAAHSS